MIKKSAYMKVKGVEINKGYFDDPTIASKLNKNAI